MSGHLRIESHIFCHISASSRCCSRTWSLLLLLLPHRLRQLHYPKFMAVGQSKVDYFLKDRRRRRQRIPALRRNQMHQSCGKKKSKFAVLDRNLKFIFKTKNRECICWVVTLFHLWNRYRLMCRHQNHTTRGQKTRSNNGVCKLKRKERDNKRKQT